MTDKAREMLSHLYKRHSREIRRFLTNILGSQEDAEDILQEAFLRVQRQDRITEIDNSRSYLFRTARNLAIDRLRRRGLGVIDRYHVVEASEFPDTGATPEQSAQQQEEYRALCKIVTGLSPQVRRAVILNKFHGLSYKEVAAVMGIAPKTVENHLARGIAECRRALQRAEQRQDDNIVNIQVAQKRGRV